MSLIVPFAKQAEKYLLRHYKVLLVYRKSCERTSLYKVQRTNNFESILIKRSMLIQF